ncbi:MAG: hypothetical protein ACRCWB_11725 [Enterovibrio sp.]
MAIFLPRLSQEDLAYDGFLDGQQRLIPDGTALEITVIGGHVGLKKETDAIMTAEIAVRVSEQGEFFGQEYTWRPKAFDTDPRKSDLAKKNLAYLDYSVGSPIINGGLTLNRDTIEACWSGKAKAIALFRTTESIIAAKKAKALERGEEPEDAEPTNFIGGLKLIHPSQPVQQPMQQQQYQSQQPVQQPVQQHYAQQQVQQRPMQQHEQYPQADFDPFGDN